MKTRYYAVLRFMCAIALLGPALVLARNGTLVAWGWNDYGQTNVPLDLAWQRPCLADLGTAWR